MKVKKKKQFYHFKYVSLTSVQINKIFNKNTKHNVSYLLLALIFVKNISSQYHFITPKKGKNQFFPHSTKKLIPKSISGVRSLARSLAPRFPRRFTTEKPPSLSHSLFFQFNRPRPPHDDLSRSLLCCRLRNV